MVVKVAVSYTKPQHEERAREILELVRKVLEEKGYSVKGVEEGRKKFIITIRVARKRRKAEEQ